MFMFIFCNTVVVYCSARPVLHVLGGATWCDDIISVVTRCVVKSFQDDDRKAEVTLPTTAKELVKSINERFGKVRYSQIVA